MHKTKTLLLTGILSLFSAAAFAAPVPSEIYKPIGARTVKAHHQGSGEFEYEAELPGKRISIPSLAEKSSLMHAATVFRLSNRKSNTMMPI